jgi:cytochrome b561
MASAWQLDRRFRYGLYATFAVLFATGIVWLLAEARMDSPNGDLWQEISAKMLVLHGGAAMIALVMLGALIPVHIQRAWRGRLNRWSGLAMAIANAALVVTAFGLYYAGADNLRSWTSDLHIAIGLAFPLLLVIHIVIGRRNRRAPKRVKQVSAAADTSRKPAPT